MNSKVALTQIQNWLEWRGHRSFVYTVKSRVKCCYLRDGEEKPCRPSYVLEIPLTNILKNMFKMSTKVSLMEANEVNFFDDNDSRIKCNIMFDSPKDEYVYDITTDTNTFVANGIVLHNCGFQNVTINLPQCAYRAGKGNLDDLYRELDSVFKVCIQAHLDKREIASKLMSRPGMPLWQVGKIAKDGRPYIDLDKATHIIGVIGLNECLHYLLGKELHEDESTLWTGIRVISYLFFLAKEAESKYGLKFSIEESPAESASRRLAKIDLYNYKDEAIVRGDGDQVYYTNSIHLRPDADVDLLTRIIWQAKFHKIIESGAIIHAFVGEKMPSTKSIASIVYKTFKNTDAAQLTISPEFTVCKGCGRTKIGLRDNCQHCGAFNIYGIEFGKFTGANEWDKKLLEK
jgi:ribonucleoside-triphosphate reductase